MLLLLYVIEIDKATSEILSELKWLTPGKLGCGNCGFSVAAEWFYVQTSWKNIRSKSTVNK